MMQEGRGGKKGSLHPEKKIKSLHVWGYINWDKSPGLNRFF